MTDPRDGAETRFTDHRNDDVEYLGTTMGGGPMFFDSADRTLFEGEYDENDDTIVERSETERELEPRESVGEALESLGDDLDWDSLSEFARERVQTDESD
jgi:hypothetical protein